MPIPVFVWLFVRRGTPIPEILWLLDRKDNAAKVEDSKCWPACFRITRRGNEWRVGRDGGRGRGPRGEGANENVEGVNEGTGGAPDFSTTIAQQLQNLLPIIL
nr:hypothetical protein [Tanacetum cinerariifolium]